MPDVLKLEVPEVYERWLYKHQPWERDPERPASTKDGVPLRFSGGQILNDDDPRRDYRMKLWLPTGHIVLPPARGGSFEFLGEGSVVESNLNATTPVTAYPFTMNCWSFSKDSGSSQGLMCIHDGAANSHLWNIADSWAGTDDIVMECIVGGAAVNATTTSPPPRGEWHMATGVGASSTSRAAFVNGGSKGTSTTNRTPTGLTTLSIGLRWPGNLAAAAYIAEAAVWNAAKSDADVGLLYAERACALNFGANLVFYLPMTGSNPNVEFDVVGGRPMIAKNSAILASKNHPFASYGLRPQTKLLRRVSAGGGGTAVKDMIGGYIPFAR